MTIQSTLGIGFCLLALTAGSAAALPQNTGPNSGMVTFHITLDAAAGKARLWAPYPAPDDHQKIENVKVTGNFTKKEITLDAATGGQILYAEWTGPLADQRFMDISFHASAEERKAPAPTGAGQDIPEGILEYTRATALIPTDGEIGRIALAAAEGKATIAERHQAIYGWVVQNTTRDPNVPGCGVGSVEQTLAKRGGKCVDISTVYVALARAAGVPAREVFGMRLGTAKGESDVTGGHHCWAEYYQPGRGWTPTDPADVRKAMLAKNLTLEQAADFKDYYLSAVDADRIVLDRMGRGITLIPPQEGGPLNYLMYPYAELDGKPVEWLAAQKELKYKITYVRD